MKKLLCILLVLCMLPLFGCAQPEDPIENPVFFYYRQKNLTYDNETSVIAKELRDAGARLDDFSYLLEQYLQGPESETLLRTFPRGSRVSFRVQEDTAVIVVNRNFATLTGIDLTLACACLTLTVCELTGTEHALIQGQDMLLDGNQSISMSRSSILLLDSSNIAVDPA